MKLDIVNFEQAKALKELGFPQESDAYNMYTDIYLDNTINLQDNHKYDKELMQIKDFCNGAFDDWDMYIAPTLELVAKWLRYEKDIIIQPCAVDTDDYLLKLLVREYDSYDECYTLSDKMYELVHYNSYEEALSAGIDKTIEFLTNKKY